MSASWETQKQGVLRLLQERPGGITSLEALNELGCMRLPSRIDELRKEGYRIDTNMVRLPNGKRVARYRFAAGQPVGARPMSIWETT